MEWNPSFLQDSSKTGNRGSYRLSLDKAEDIAAPAGHKKAQPGDMCDEVGAPQRARCRMSLASRNLALSNGRRALHFPDITTVVRTPVKFPLSREGRGTDDRDGAARSFVPLLLAGGAGKRNEI